MAQHTLLGNRFAGFTLVELLVVLAVLAMLAAMVAPLVSPAISRAEEAALRENLFVMRKAIDAYYADKGRYPEELEILRQAKYLRRIPVDPISGDAWVVSHNEGKPAGVIDVHSASEKVSSEGTRYASW